MNEFSRSPALETFCGQADMPSGHTVASGQSPPRPAALLDRLLGFSRKGYKVVKGITTALARCPYIVDRSWGSAVVGSDPWCCDLRGATRPFHSQAEITGLPPTALPSRVQNCDSPGVGVAWEGSRVWKHSGRGQRAGRSG